MYRWHIQPGIYRIRDATVGEELISGHFQGNSVVEVRADGNCVTFYRVTPIVHAEVVSVDETTAVFLPYPAEDVGAGDVGGKVEIFVVMELDYFRYFLCYQVDTGDAAGNGRGIVRRLPKSGREAEAVLPVPGTFLPVRRASVRGQGK